MEQAWWSQRFIGVLESFGLGTRLARGRSYARNGYVIDLDVVSGAVHARVRGTRPQPYRVIIGTERLSDDEWLQVARTLSKRARYLSELLAGMMPGDIDQAFRGSRVSLFPAHVSELQTICNCPDDANPCKHIAAAFYQLAEAFDDDPFLVFAWRGRTREQLIDDLRLLRLESLDDGDEQRQGADDGWPTFERAPAIESCVDNFWDHGPGLADVRPRLRISPVPDILLRQLDPPQVDMGSRQFLDVLAPLYGQAVASLDRTG